MVCGPVFNILSHPVTYIMYFITENEAPPPNILLSGSPHQLSKSLPKYSKVATESVNIQFDSNLMCLPTIYIYQQDDRYLAKINNGQPFPSYIDTVIKFS